jgi:hypothetical protein
VKIVRGILMLKAVRFRIQNFRNIDDSGWIPLERVTNFVGRNESGDLPRFFGPRLA